ncbi:hypothetical protein [Motilimonas sp. E26]|uniref:hypothetical protein n=1 Tax=Motilimonas sp. E26 TaxID=2865674 RepID=UPI001E5D5F36|nr:hypothetical protein [Motilimonas sp. E26]MCE0556216.1 hypothetical protein [Motilimonas sp. E26]
MDIDDTDLRSQLKAVAQLFRQGKEAAGNQHLVVLIDTIEKEQRTLTQQQTEQLNNILKVLFAAQQRRDILFVADIIEYEITKLFTTL